MLKKAFMLAVLSILSVLMFSGLPLSAQQEESGVNSTDYDLIIHGGLGYGQTLFGVVQNSSNSGDLGTGPGGAADLGAMLNISALALGINFTQANFNTMKWDQTVSGTKHEYESKGDGYFRTIEFILGVKVFTEPGDMGYTLFYGGYKMWSAERNVDSVTVDGITGPVTVKKYELNGDGWVAGFRDLSTFPLGGISLALQTGLWIDKMPISELKKDGTKQTLNKSGSGGAGGELGLGLAFEDIGLSVIASFKMDVTASVLNNTSGDDDVVGAGYAQFFLTVTKDFSI